MNSVVKYQLLVPQNKPSNLKGIWYKNNQLQQIIYLF